MTLPVIEKYAFVLCDKCNGEYTAHHEGMSNDICVRFGERLRKLREKKGFNQLQFSEKCGIENSHLSRLESGKREPGLYMLELLAKGLGITISELTKGI